MLKEKKATLRAEFAIWQTNNLLERGLASERTSYTSHCAADGWSKGGCW